jgi:hypothetical protein
MLSSDPGPETTWASGSRSGYRRVPIVCQKRRTLCRHAFLVFLILSVLSGTVACRPASAPRSENRPVPEVPSVVDPGLRRSLQTLRAMVAEHARLSAQELIRDDKTASRLSALRSSFADLHQQCLNELQVAGDGQAAVKEFLQNCTSAMAAP